MILTQEEYERGILDFRADLPPGTSLRLWTSTTDTLEEKGTWEGPYTNPSGSKVLSPARRFGQIRVDFEGGPGGTSPMLYRVRWDRGGITEIYPGPGGLDGPPDNLRLGRDYGWSCRLVVQPRKAIWPEPFVIVNDRVRIRFQKSANGYRTSGLSNVITGPNGKKSVEVNVEPVKVEGDSVEILASVPNEDQSSGRDAAKALGETILGLLALSLGEQTIGETLLTEYYFNTPGNEQGQLLVPVIASPNLQIGISGSSAADSALVSLQTRQIHPSIGLALRWYAKALSSNTPLDSFVGFFLGLDILTSGYFAYEEEGALRPEYSALQDYFENSRPSVDPALKKFALERLRDVPLATKFRQYWSKRFGTENAESAKFPKLNRLRSELLHGNIRSVDLSDMRDARLLLESLLAKELGLTLGQMPVLMELLLTRVLAADLERRTEISG